MADSPSTPHSPLQDTTDLSIKGWLWLVFGALCVGLLTGLLGSAFRATLMFADHWRGVFIAMVHGYPAGWLLVMVSAAFLVGIATWLVQFAPLAAGSGVPRVESVLRDELEPAPKHIIPVKFFGGSLAIGSGLALGPEGPAVQMGAVVGDWISRWIPGIKDDLYVLMAAGAGAGLATAFNAPIGGAAFVFEEMMQGFNSRLLTATTISCTTAIAVARLVLGPEPTFSVAPLAAPPIANLPLYAVLGLVCGLVGVAYNRTILATLNAFDAFDHWPRSLKGALVGAGVGLLAWFLPHLVGSGGNIAQTILSAEAVVWLVLPALLIRFILGPLSSAAGAPGGLFAPLLVLGAQLGFLGGTLGHTLIPNLVTEATSFTVVGMAAFFTASVRSPFTCIFLVVEMTDSVQLLLAMLAAASMAYAVPTLLGNQPIYAALGERRNTIVGKLHAWPIYTALSERQVVAQNKQDFKEGSPSLPRKGRR